MNFDDKLDQAARQLATEVTPERDLWPGIEQAIRTPRRQTPWLAQAAAVVLLIGASSSITYLAMKDGDDPLVGVAPDLVFERAAFGGEYHLGPGFTNNTLGLDGEVEVLQYPSGFSNLTYMLRIDDTDVVLRRPPFGSKPKSGHDMKREHDVLVALHGSFPYCPKPLIYCDDETIIGSPFYVMERIEGIIVRRDFPTAMSLSPEDVRVLFDRVIDVHVELHSVDFRAVGLEHFGNPEGYVERQIGGWSDRYRKARTPDVPDCEGIMAWLEENRPPDSGQGCIVHNDFRLDNLVLDAADGFAAQDAHIAGFVRDGYKPLVVAINKWDLIEKDSKTADAYNQR